MCSTYRTYLTFRQPSLLLLSCSSSSLASFLARSLSADNNCSPLRNQRRRRRCVLATSNGCPLPLPPKQHRLPVAASFGRNALHKHPSPPAGPWKKKMAMRASALLCGEVAATCHGQPLSPPTISLYAMREVLVASRCPALITIRKVVGFKHPPPPNTYSTEDPERRYVVIRG